MANVWEKAISILAENLNLGLSYLITIVKTLFFVERSVEYVMENKMGADW